MIRAPEFERSALVTDDPQLAAQVSARFVRPGRYFVVLDEPRTLRPDASNEITRRRNAFVKAGVSNLLVGMTPSVAAMAIAHGWPERTISNDPRVLVEALKGKVGPSKGVLRWGPNNLGVGVYRAKQSRCELRIDLSQSPDDAVVIVGNRLLVACERGEPLSEVIASNLAFSVGASLFYFDELPKAVRVQWTEELYALGEGGDVSSRLAQISDRARGHVGLQDASRFSSILFVTGGFPWGICFPEVPTTHMSRYPDFGTAVVQGTWASHRDRSARAALFIDPGAVVGSEIDAMRTALLKNGSLVRVMRGSEATVARVQSVLELLPYDVVVLSSHAGDVPGERVTYEYLDSDSRRRRLVINEVRSFSYVRSEDLVRVTEFDQFHSLDGVAWSDEAGKAALPVGSAMTTWIELSGLANRQQYVTAREPVDRVIGSMAIQLHDDVWLFSTHAFASEAAPLIVNNSCWSWHEISERAMFAGARGYVGSLFPITDAEAQSIGTMLFDQHLCTT